MSELKMYSAAAVASIIGKLPTSQQRINARNKLRDMTNTAINESVKKKVDLLRELRSEPESSKRNIYAEISQLERMKIEE